MRFGVLLLFLVAVCCFVGSLIPQGEEAAFYVTKYPEYHGILLRLRLNDIFKSLYFIILTALLCLNLTLCSLSRFRSVVSAARNAESRAAQMPDTVLSDREDIERLEGFLLSIRCKKTEFGEAAVFSKNRFGFCGTFITHLAILMTIIFGALALYTPKVTDKTCFPGESIVMDDGTEIFVDRFSIEDPDGTLNYSSDIRVVLPDGRTSGAHSISVNHPLSFGSYKIYQQTYGTAGSITVLNTENGGEDLLTLDDVSFLSLDGKNGLWFEAVYPDYSRDEEGNFSLVTSAAGHYTNPVYQVLTASDGEFTPVLAFPGESMDDYELRFTFNTPVEYPGLRMKYTPPIIGILLCVSFLLMIVGLYITFFLSPVLVKTSRVGYAVCGAKTEEMKLRIEELNLGNTI